MSTRSLDFNLKEHSYFTELDRTPITNQVDADKLTRITEFKSNFIANNCMDDKKGRIQITIGKGI